MHKGKTSATAVAAVLLVAVATPAPAAERPEVWLPEIQESALLPTDSLIQGEIARPDGRSFSRGAQVVLYAYPPAEVDSTLEVGDSIRLTPVAKALVDADGEFELRVAGVSELTRFASKEGDVNFEVQAVDGDYFAPYTFSRSLMTTGKDAHLVSTDDAARPSEMRRAKALPEKVRLVSERERPGLGDSLRAAGPDRVVNKGEICGETLVSNLGSREVVIGETHAKAAGTRARLTYTKGASSTLGVGVSASGKYGSFSSSGTFNVSSTDTVGFGWQTGSKRYSTYFRYGKYSRWCYPNYDATKKYIYGYKVRANKFEGGSRTISVSTPAANYCKPFASKASHTKDNTSATAWSNGANLKAAIGASLYVRTGYTSKISVKYENTGAASRKICGTNDVVGGTPGRIVTK